MSGTDPAQKKMMLREPGRFAATLAPRSGSRFASTRGMTLVEIVVASALLVVSMGGLFQLSVQSLRLLKVQTETAKAAEAIQERVDYLRGIPWADLTKSVNYTNYTYSVVDPATSVSTSNLWVGLLNTLPAAFSSLSSPVETVTISAYPGTGTPPTPITVTNSNGTVTVSPSGGANLSAQTTVRIDIRLA
jgi:Tfp pilus assembly protein PilV